MVSRKVLETWGDARDLDVLGLGYATPVLSAIAPAARRVVAAMPAQQGVELWPLEGRNLACLAEEDALPFQNAFFDRILAVHALEESPDPVALLREVWRVLSPTGRVVVVTAARNGLWANAEKTPSAMADPTPAASWPTYCARPSWSRPAGPARSTLPPVSWLAGWAEGSLEQAGSRLWPGFAGLVLTEAVKESFAIKARPRARARSWRVRPCRHCRPAGRLFRGRRDVMARQTLGRGAVRP